MTTLAVVVTIDPEGQVPDQLLGAVQDLGIVIEAQFVFEGGEEAIHHGVVPTAVFGRHAAADLVVFQQLPVGRCPVFTSGDFVASLQAVKIKISWTGRKRCYDNILVESLRRTVKYEEVYLHAYSDGWDAEVSLARFLWRYCHVRPQSSLGGRTPYEVYTEIEPCSSRPELTMSGARTVQ